MKEKKVCSLSPYPNFWYWIKDGRLKKKKWQGCVICTDTLMATSLNACATERTLPFSLSVSILLLENPRCWMTFILTLDLCYQGFPAPPSDLMLLINAASRVHLQRAIRWSCWRARASYGCIHIRANTVEQMLCSVLFCGKQRQVFNSAVQRRCSMSSSHFGTTLPNANTMLSVFGQPCFYISALNPTSSNPPGSLTRSLYTSSHVHQKTVQRKGPLYNIFRLWVFRKYLRAAFF